MRMVQEVVLWILKKFEQEMTEIFYGVQFVYV